MSKMTVKKVKRFFVKSLKVYSIQEVFHKITGIDHSLYRRGLNDSSNVLCI